MGSERRRHRRVQVQVPFRLVDEDGGEEAFDLIDLSEAGARITCSHPIAAMTRIRVAIRLPGDKVGKDDGEAVQVDTRGVVVWSHQVGDGRYDVGVFFSDIEDEARHRLQSFVAAAP